MDYKSNALPIELTGQTESHVFEDGYTDWSKYVTRTIVECNSYPHQCPSTSSVTITLPLKLIYKLLPLQMVNAVINRLKLNYHISHGYLNMFTDIFESLGSKLGASSHS